MLAYDSVLCVNPNHSVSKYRGRSVLVKSRMGKPWPKGQIWPATCFCTAHELKMAFASLND